MNGTRSFKYLIVISEAVRSITKDVQNRKREDNQELVKTVSNKVVQYIRIFRIYIQQPSSEKKYNIKQIVTKTYSKISFIKHIFLTNIIKYIPLIESWLHRLT